MGGSKVEGGRFARVLAVFVSMALVCLLFPFASFAQPEGEAALGAGGVPGYVEGEALVTYHSGLPAADGGLWPQSVDDPLAAAGFTLEDSWDLSAADLAAAVGLAAQSEDASDAAPAAAAVPADADLRVALVTGGSASTEELIAQLSALDCAVVVSPNYLIELCSVTNPDDTLYRAGLQYGLTSTASGIGYQAALDADAAASDTKENVVAVIDTGVDYTNPDLAPVMWENPGNIGLEGRHGYDFADNDDDPMPGSTPSAMHGSHCAGIVAAATDNAQGVAGTALHSKIMAFKIASDDTTGKDLTISAVVASYGYISAAMTGGVPVVAVSNSWSLNQYSPVLDYCVNQVGKQGALSLFAAGNNAADAESDASYATTIQLASPYAVVVASSNEDNEVSSFSNYHGYMVDVAAPGSKIVSTARTSTRERPSQYEYNAHLAHLTGKQMFYLDGKQAYDSMGLADAGNCMLYVKDASGASSRASTADRACLTVAQSTYGGQDAIKVTLDAAKLSEPVAQYFVLLNGPIGNHFKGMTSAEAKDYRAAVDVFRDAGMASTSSATGVLLLQSGDKKTMLMDSSVNMDSADHHVNAQTTFGALDTSSDTLFATLNIIFADKADAAARPAICTCYITDLGIGAAADAPDYAYASGTSMATPMLAGCLGELAALYPGETALELRGRLVGGTAALAAGQEGKTATDGRFDFNAALDASKLNANTWSLSCDGGTITLYGRALEGATLVIDGTTTVTPTSQSDTQLSFTADAALCDGKVHRFDVTDGSSGRVQRAGYTVPLLPDAPAADSSLISLGALPGDKDETSRGVLVSSTNRLFFADRFGTYLYGCADPETEAWTKLAAPSKLPYAASSSPDIHYQYLNGKIHAFYADERTVDSEMPTWIYHASYDIATNAWTPFAQVASLGEGATSGTGEYLALAACDNTVYAVYSQVECEEDKVAGGNKYGGDIFLLSSTDNGSTFGARLLTIEDSDVCAIPALCLANGTVCGLGVRGKTGDVRLLSFNGATCIDKGAFAANSLGLEDAHIFANSVMMATGSGTLATGFSYKGLGDTSLLDVTSKAWTGLGSLLGSADKHITPTSATMYDGVVYISGIDDPALYTLPKDAATKLVSTDCTLSTRVVEGGTATVVDWRGKAAESLEARAGDQAVWTATPLGDAYAFEGWYDEDGTLVSTDAVYVQSSAAPSTYTARFKTVNQYGGPGDGSEDAGLAHAGSAAKATTLPRTGDWLFTWL